MELIDSKVETPENCKPVSVLVDYRYKHYKESSQQFKRGLKGRWQAFNGYGWDNVDAPSKWIKVDES